MAFNFRRFFIVSLYIYSGVNYEYVTLQWINTQLLYGDHTYCALSLTEPLVTCY